MAMDDDMNAVTVERLERRLGEECSELRTDMGGVRLEIAAVRQEMATGFGNLRAEIADRNADLLKWMLAFIVAQTAALAAVIALFR